MAKQILHIPLDRGIDQSKATGGAEPPSGLKECANLWHAKVGELSTRPGTARAGGALDAASAEPFAAVGVAGDLGVVLSGSSVNGQTRPRSDAEEQAWFDLGAYAAPVPTVRCDIGAPATATTLSKHVAIWRHLMLVAYELSGTGYIQAYDRTTGVLLARTTISAGGMQGGWACHGDDFAPTLLRWDTGTGLRRHTLTDETDGTYESVGTAPSVGASITDPILVCGHDDGSLNFAEVNSGGVVYHIPSQTTLVGSLVGILSVEPQNCASYAGRAWFVGVGGGDVYVCTVDGDTLVNIDSETTSDLQTCIVPIGENRARVLSNAATEVSRHTVDATGAVGAKLSSYYSSALVLGGATYDGLRARCWFILNSLADPLYAKLALVDVDDARPEKQPVLYADFLTDSPADTFPQASADGLGSFAVMFPEFLDFTSTAAQNIALEFRTQATRPIVDFGGRATIPGGVLYDISGDAIPSLPITPPRITVTEGTTGALKTLSTYQFVAVFQLRDSTGAIRQGTLSEAATVTLTGANDSVSVAIVADDTSLPGWEVVIYRTEGNGSIFFRDSTELANLQPGDTFTSTQSDEALSDNAILYTEGGVLPNDAAPSHRFVAVGKQRLWIGGLWRPFRLQFSKETLRGEAAGFPDDPSHWIDFDSDLTGIAVIDDAVLAFHRRSVSLVAGDGPSTQGVGAFTVRPITIGVGADDWRSIVTTPIGVLFAGNGTIWLLGRGFAAPENIGAMVQDILADYPEVISSALIDYGHQQCAQFLCRATDGAVTRLVFSLRALSWYQWDAPAGTTLLGESFVRDSLRLTMLPEETPATDVALLSEDTALTSDTPAAESVAVATTIETHDIHNWGLATDAIVHRVWFRARVAEAQTWNAELIYDGGRSVVPMNGRSPTIRDGYQSAEYRLKDQHLRSLALRLEAGPVTLAGLMLETESDGAPKLVTEQRRG